MPEVKPKQKKHSLSVRTRNSDEPRIPHLAYKPKSTVDLRTQGLTMEKSISAGRIIINFYAYYIFKSVVMFHSASKVGDTSKEPKRPGERDV